MNPDERALLDAIIAAPDDDAPRLVYADWLQEHSDPRGEFMALHMAASESVESGRALSERADALLARHRQRWDAELGPGVEAVEYRRGLASAAHLRLEQRGELLAVLDRAPIDQLALTWPDDDWDPDEPDAEPSGAQMRQAIARELAHDPRMGRLRVLDLTRDTWGQQALTELLRSVHLGRVRELSIGDGDSKLYAACALAECPSLERISSISLCGDYEGDLGDDGAHLLAHSPRLSSLEALYLYNVNLGPPGARALAASPYLTGLRVLHFGTGSHSLNHIGANGAAAIAASETLGQLERLVLDFNGVGDAGFIALVRSRLLPQLTQLSAASNNLSDAGLRGLARSDGLPALSHLELTFNRALTADGVGALARAPRFARLRSLWLRQCPAIGPDGAAAIATSPHAVGLRDLNLLECGIGSAGARALAGSPYLDGLVRLQVSGNRCDESSRALLEERFGDRVEARP